MVHMVAMKRTKDEKKAMEKSLGRSPGAGPDGPSIHLDGHHLEKLGMEELPEVGEKYHMRGHAEVTSASHSDYGDMGGPSRSVGMTFTHMHVPKKVEEGDEVPEEKDEKEPSLHDEINSAFDKSEKKSDRREKISDKVASKGKKVKSKEEGESEKKWKDKDAKTELK